MKEEEYSLYKYFKGEEKSPFDAAKEDAKIYSGALKVYITIK